MEKYVCYGDCGGESDTPGVCQTDGCSDFGKTLHVVKDEDADTEDGLDSEVKDDEDDDDEEEDEMVDEEVV